MKPNKQRQIKPSNVEADIAAVNAKLAAEGEALRPQVEKILAFLSTQEIPVTIRSGYKVNNTGFQLGMVIIEQKTVEHPHWALHLGDNIGAMHTFTSLQLALDYLIKEYNIPEDVLNGTPVPA